jgi:hypothetical protein
MKELTWFGHITTSDWFQTPTCMYASTHTEVGGRAFSGAGDKWLSDHLKNNSKAAARHR